MLKYLNALQRTATFSKQVEAQKPKPLIKAKVSNQILEQQRMDRVYFEFQAIRTDPLDIIRQRFIKKKKLLGNRRFYMPNKTQYMKDLDRYMREIQSKHDLDIMRGNYVLPTTIGQKIQLELNSERTKFYFALITEDKWVIRICLILIAFLSFCEIAFWNET